MTIEYEQLTVGGALRPSDIADDYRGAFRSVAYLLRALKRAVLKGDASEHRKKSLPRELTTAIEGEHTPGDTCATWLTKLARRWDVALAGDDEGRALRVYFPEGYAAWDVVTARVPSHHLDRIVESADLLAMFAMRFGPMPGRDDEEVEREVDEAVLDVAEPARPVAPWVPAASLMGTVIEPARWRSLWRAEGAFAHGSDDRTGNVVGIRRQPMTDALTGDIAEVPFFAGNAVRGAGRRLIMGDLIERVGLTVPELRVSVAHTLLDGGTLEGGSPAINAALRRRLRELLPALDLYGGNWDRTETMAGWLLCEPAVLVCRETAGMLARWLAPETDPMVWRAQLMPAAELVSQQQLTSRPSELADPESPILARVEVVSTGALFAHRVGLHGRNGYGGAPALVRSCLAHLIDLMRAKGAVGAATSRGMGTMLMGAYEAIGGAIALPSSEAYLAHVDAHRSEIRELIMASVEEIARASAPVEMKPAEKAPKAEKPAKGKRGAKAESEPLGLSLSLTSPDL